MRTTAKFVTVTIYLITCVFAASTFAATEKIKTPDTFINFDTLFAGDQLTNQFAALGVTFEGTFEGNITAGLIGIDGDAGTLEFGNSPPNFVILGVGTLTIHFETPVSYLSFRAGDADVAGEGFGVTAFDADGNVLDSQTVLLFEDAAIVNIPREGISKLRIFGIYGCVNCGSGFAIDDISYLQ